MKGEIKPVQPSFYDDIIRLPDIIEKVLEAKRPNMLPSRWVSCRRGRCVLWRKFSPILDLGSFTRTCGSSTKLRHVSGSLREAQVVLTLMKSCSTIPCWNARSERLHILYFCSQVKEREDHKVFQCLETYLGPIKQTLLAETQQWIECLGALLEQTAKQELENLIASLENLENCLVYPKNGDELETVLAAISTIWGMSLEVEITYREIEERYRTLQMYGLKIESKQVEAARALPDRWTAIFKRSKEVHFRVTPLKEKYTEITKMQILKFLKEVG